jgi:MFS family permease
MYLATRAAPPDAPATAEPAEAKRRVSRNVVMLGFTSMFTDISSEMVASVLPLFFMLQLGFSPLQFGVVDGVYQGLGAVLCIFAAVAADRRQRHKRVAGAGYSFSAGAGFILVVASGSWIPVLGSLYLDRLGKGIRTAPRDALISLSSAKDRLGLAFGVHRSLDTAGAIIGPLLASYLLARNSSGYNVVFAVSFFIAIIGLGVLFFFVEDRRVTVVADKVTSSWSVLRAAVVLLRDKPFRRVWLVALGFALLTPGDALLYLALEHRVDLSAGDFPLLYFGTSVVFLVAAVPCGRLADRIGPMKVFIGGEALLFGAFATVGSRATGRGIVLLMLIMLGAYYASTDGVLMALISPLIPDTLRTSGMALFVAAIALGHLFASIAFGWAWDAYGPSVAIHLFMIGLAGVIAAGGWVLHRTELVPAS